MSAHVRIEAHHGLYRGIQSLIGSQTPWEILEPPTVTSEVIARICNIEQRDEGHGSGGLLVRYEARYGRWARAAGFRGRRPASGLLGQSLGLQLRLVLELVSQLATPHTRDVEARAAGAGGRGHVALKCALAARIAKE